MSHSPRLRTAAGSRNQLQSSASPLVIQNSQNRRLLYTWKLYEMLSFGNHHCKIKDDCNITKPF